MCNIRRFYWFRELYEADFYKPGICGSGRTWASAWNVFRRATSRGGRRRRAAVDFVVCFGWGGIFPVVFFPIFTFFFERTRPAASMRPPCPIYLLTSNDITCNIRVGCLKFRSCATALGTHGGELCNKYVFLPTTQHLLLKTSDDQNPSHLSSVSPHQSVSFQWHLLHVSFSIDNRLWTSYIQPLPSDHVSCIQIHSNIIYRISAIHSIAVVPLQLYRLGCSDESEIAYVVVSESNAFRYPVGSDLRLARGACRYTSPPTVFAGHKGEYSYAWGITRKKLRGPSAVPLSCFSYFPPPITLI